MFSVVGVTKNNPMSVIPQIASRLVILWGAFPHVEPGHFAVFQACLMWSWVETVRFSYYMLKMLGYDSHGNMMQIIIGHLRYNSFWIAYPVGITGELFSVWNAVSVMRKMDPKDRPGVQMPN